MDRERDAPPREQRAVCLTFLGGGTGGAELGLSDSSFLLTATFLAVGAAGGSAVGFAGSFFAGSFFAGGFFAWGFFAGGFARGSFAVGLVEGFLAGWGSVCNFRDFFASRSFLFHSLRRSASTLLTWEGTSRPPRLIASKRRIFAVPFLLLGGSP